MSERRKDADRLVEQVRERYAGIAEGKAPGCCPTTGNEALRIGYREEDLAGLPEGANLGLGCGAPVELLGLEPGETVVDLGSGAGIDAFLAARKVGPAGTVIGIDMTPSMLEKARASAVRAGFPQVEFRQGRLEALPVADSSVDALTSNCVINLVPDKRAVFREVFRVLRPGGRLVVSDILLDGQLPRVVEDDLMAYVGCVAGALPREDYFAHVAAAGLQEVRILKDVDYLAGVGCDALPGETLRLMAEQGVGVEELAGKVRSVTFRAVKPVRTTAR